MAVFTNSNGISFNTIGTNSIIAANSNSTMSMLASTFSPTAIFVPSHAVQPLALFYDPATNLAWLAYDKRTMTPVNNGFQFSRYTHTNYYYDPQAPPSEDPYPSPEATNAFSANINPSLQPMQIKNPTLTPSTSGRVRVSLATPRRTSFSEPAGPSRPTKRLRSSEQVPDAPNVYKKIGKCEWRCVLRRPNSGKVCGLVCKGRRNLYRHIGSHAMKEQKLIDKGQLLAEDAIAVHEVVLMSYQCTEKNCQYREDNGVDFTCKGHRVDGEKARHIKEYHS